MGKDYGETLVAGNEDGSVTTAAPGEELLTKVVQSCMSASPSPVLTRDMTRERRTIANTLCVSEKQVLRSEDKFALYRKLRGDKANKMYEFAQAAFSEGEFESCLVFLRKALLMDANNVKYYVLRAETYLQLCDYTSAVLNYKRVCIMDPDNENYFSKLAFIYCLHGQCLLDEEQFLEALEAFSKAVEMRPHMSGYHIRCLASLSALKRHKECLALVNKRLEVQSDSPDLLIMRARLHMLFSNVSKCYFDVKDALDLDPDSVQATLMHRNLEQRAECYKEQALKLAMKGKISEALMKISNAIDTNPSVIDYHVLRAVFHRKNKSFSAAVDDLVSVIDRVNHDPNQPQFIEAKKQLLLTFNDFAVDCFRKGFYEDAILLLNKAIKGEKDEKALYINRGDCFFKQSHLHYALLDYQQALELGPHDQRIFLRLAVVYNELGVLEFADRNYARAEEHFSAAISYNPSLASCFVSRARCRYMNENMEGARVDSVSALLLDSSKKEAFPLFARLFPGKTVPEVLKDDFGCQVRLALSSVIEDFNREVDCSAGLPTPVAQFDEISPVADFNNAALQSRVRESMKQCMQESEFYVNIIKGKKKVNDLVESVIQARQDLNSYEPKVDVDVMAPVSEFVRKSLCKAKSNRPAKSTR